eukprot:Pgem_evm1s12644
MTKILLYLGANAIVSTCIAFVLWYKLSNDDKKNRKNKPDNEDEELEPENHGKLGPYHPDARYELNFVGRVDQLYDHFGPKPFEFNKEVVDVFDDMVSRSVPLYCEVIDLLIYWVHRYYVPGTKIVDLGCSTGTTIEVVARSFHGDKVGEFVGIDNSEAMVNECKKKLSWVCDKHQCDIITGDIVGFPINNASFVIMNYTLQFIPIPQRYETLRDIFNGLVENGVIFISEKVRSDDAEYQETCTWIYEDFKERRGYSKRYIARKKDALMNVLVPFTEDEMKSALHSVGFEHVEILAKWNNFTTFVARKSGMKLTIGKNNQEVKTPYIDSMFEYNPIYLNEFLNTAHIQTLCLERINVFSRKQGLSVGMCAEFDDIAKDILSLPTPKSNDGGSDDDKSSLSKTFIVNDSVLTIGDKDSEITPEQYQIWEGLAHKLKPWKKGPLNIFGLQIDTEWRSDWKWERIKKHVSMKDKVICDLGCGNGYFMFRMLEANPKLIVGLDPSLHAWLEFQTFRRVSGVNNIHLEILKGESMDLFPAMFDVSFCLGVLYHTPDPIGMLRKIHKSMKQGGQLIVDCQ